jgi:hypothetical protein
MSMEPTTVTVRANVIVEQSEDRQAVEERTRTG